MAKSKRSKKTVSSSKVDPPGHLPTDEQTEANSSQTETMGIEVPAGSAPEQPRAASKRDNRRSLAKSRIVVTFMAMLAVAAILMIALLPEWGDDEDAVPAGTEGTEGTEPPVDTIDQRQTHFESNLGPFDVKIPLFSANITQGYATTEELEYDLEQLAKFLLNDAINSNVKAGIREPGNEEDGGEILMGAVPPTGAEPEAGDQAFAATDTSGGDGSLSEATDFETNNQEENVDKADKAKSNGNLFFVAYDDYLLVWDTKGELKENITMPPIELTGNPYDQEYPNDMIVAEPQPEPLMMMPPIYWNPKPYIQALLLEGNRLTVIVSGYGYAFAAELNEPPILNDYLGTHIRVYEINDDHLELVKTKDVNGSFRNAYSVENNAYVVTQSWMNTYDHLLLPIQRWQPMFVNLDDESYLEEVLIYAEQELIPDFVANLRAELGVNGEIDLARLSVYADSISGSSEIETSLFANSMANAFTQVVSFDMTEVTDDLSESTELTVQSSGTFQPGSFGQVYATEGMIIVADQGWNWVEEEEGSAQTTYLLGFRLQGASSVPAMIGSVPGYLLNPYSLDFVEVGEDSYVRIATTMNFWFFGGFADDMIVMDTAVDGGEMAATSGGAAVSSPTAEGVDTTTLPAREDNDADVEVAQGVPDEGESINPNDQDGVDVEVAPDVPDTVESVDLNDQEGSSTKNQVIIMKITDQEGSEAKLEKVGSVTLGKKDEIFTAVRFFDKIAYAVTFEQTDPFYVLDLTDPTDPQVIGELNVTGFSEYLHPINDDNSVLIAVGQEATDDGRILGLQISIFDASDPTNPQVLDRLVVENSEDQWSSSTVSWDERAFRYLNLGEAGGRLIIPMSIHSWGGSWVEAGENYDDYNFEGFAVFSVDENNRINPEYLEIDHSDSMNYADECGYCGWLPERSFVINGSVMTLKGHSVVSTDLVSEETDWVLNINELGLCCSR